MGAQRVNAVFARRTPDGRATHLLPHVKASDHILDVGCGPGFITLGLARRVPDGRVMALIWTKPSILPA